MNDKEIEIFLEYFFLYKWTKSNKDFHNLKIAKKFLNERNIKKNLFIRKILLKLDKCENNNDTESHNFYTSKKNLDLVCSIMFLRNIIIDKNKKKKFKLKF